MSYSLFRNPRCQIQPSDIIWVSRPCMVPCSEHCSCPHIGSTPPFADNKARPMHYRPLSSRLISDVIRGGSRTLLSMSMTTSARQIGGVFPTRSSRDDHSPRDGRILHGLKPHPRKSGGFVVRAPRALPSFALSDRALPGYQETASSCT
jgi:hypothetical protein